MDPTTIMSTVAIAVSVAGAIITAINHKRIRSRCFGQEQVLSIDIEDTTPNNLRIKIPKPPAPVLPESPEDCNIKAPQGASN